MQSDFTGNNSKASSISFDKSIFKLCSKIVFIIPKAARLTPSGSEEPVGFLMIGHNMEAFCEVCGDDTPDSLKNNYLFWRLMVDEKFQGKGYGKAGIKLALDFIKTWPCGKAEYCVISYEPENEAAKNLYASFGFEENGEMADEEVVAVLKL